jgi:predicted RNA methylase
MLCNKAKLLKKSHQRIYGQFFTPDAVVACCYALLAGSLPARPQLVDPACGDGAFLRYAAAQGLAAREDIYGCDIDAALVGALVAAGLPHVRRADGLDAASLPVGAFDLVIGNPPFGIATAGGERPMASEVRFLLRALELVRPGGAIALVLPNGVLANERLRALRADLLRCCTLLAIVALPRATFQRTGTSAACSILLLRKAPMPPAHRVFFALAAQVGDLVTLAALYRAGATADACAERPYYWLPQSAALAQRMDTPFWHPDYRMLLARIGAAYPLRPLGELIDPRRELLVGDHVRPSRGEAKGPGLPYEYYQTREFMAAGYNYVQAERCDERAYRRLRRTAVQQHDILISCAGVGGAGSGRACLITHQPGPSCTGDVFILRVRALDQFFLYLFLAASSGRTQLLHLQNGVGTANLSADELLQVEVPLVEPTLQREFAARYAPVAALHDRSMAALSRSDAAAFQRERTASEELLAALKNDLDVRLRGD